MMVYASGNPNTLASLRDAPHAGDGRKELQAVHEGRALSGGGTLQTSASGL